MPLNEWQLLEVQAALLCTQSNRAVNSVIKLTLLARYTLFLTLLLFWVQISAWKIPHSKGSLVLNWKGGQSCSLITLKLPWKRDWSLLASSTQEPAAGNFSKFCSEWSSSALMYWSESFSLSSFSSPLLIYKTSDEIETHSRKHQRFQTSEPYLSLCTLISIFFLKKLLIYVRHCQESKLKS